MKALLIAALALAPALSFAAPAKTMSAEDAIKAEFTEFNAAWAKGDAKKLASFWTEDGTIINPVGVEGKGRAEIEKVISTDMSTFLKGAKAELKVDKVYSINDSTVFADCTHEMTNMHGPDGKAMPNMNAHVVALAVKQNDKWMWAHVRPYFFMPKPAAHTMK